MGDYMNIFNIKERLEYLEEVAILTQLEWGKPNLNEEEFKNKIIKKFKK